MSNDKPQYEIDVQALGERGHISQAEAQELHTVLCQHSGTTDTDAIIAEWNKHSPEAPWGHDGKSHYITELTGIVLAFMSAKLNEVKGMKTMDRAKEDLAKLEEADTMLKSLCVDSHRAGDKKTFDICQQLLEKHEVTRQNIQAWVAAQPKEEA